MNFLLFSFGCVLRNAVVRRFVRPRFVLVGHAEMTSDCLSDSTLLARLVHFLHVESVLISIYTSYLLGEEDL